MIRTDQDLASVVGREEGETLEFKEDTWCDGEECAKDIAAFGNARGGQILVGVREEAATSCANGFHNWLRDKTESGEQQRIQHWLEHALRPRDFVDRLTYGWITAPEGSRVLSVEVPLSARSCLAVARDGGAQRKGTRFQFPVRGDKVTRYMEYDEVCRRIADPSRAVRLRLRELRAEGPATMFVRLASPVVLLTSGGSRQLIRDPSMAYDASLGEDSDEGFQVIFCATYSWGSIRHKQLRGRDLLIPYAMVRTLWRDPRGVLCVALFGQVETSSETVQVSTG